MAQHDQNIADGPGAQVRADMNAAIKALFSNSSGDIEPQTKVAGQLWYDTGVNPPMLRQRNNDNSGWLSLPVGFDPASVWTKGEAYSKPQSDDAIAAAIKASAYRGVQNRSFLLNGNFNVAQRAATQTISGFGNDDRWNNGHSGSTKTQTVQAFALGQTEVPGNPMFYSRTVVSSVAGAANYCLKQQALPTVHRMAGMKLTTTFYAKADAARPIGFDMGQSFGSGGTFSPLIQGISGQKINLTTAWKRYDIVTDMPSIAGKSIGTGENYTFMRFWFDAGSNYSAYNGGLGQQSGTFDIAHVSCVPGDATTEADPFGKYDYDLDLLECMRFYQSIYVLPFDAWVAAGGQFLSVYPYPVPMRASPSIAYRLQGNSNCANVTTNFSNAQTIGTQAIASATGAAWFATYIDLSADI